MMHHEPTHELEPPTPQLEELALTEIGDLLEESRQAFAPPRDNPQETSHSLFAAMQTDPSFQILGYRNGDKPVSYIVALSHKNPGTVSIGPMFVSAQARGLGMGKRQVVDFVTRAAHNGYTSVFTKTWGQNQASQHIFNELGFTVHKVKPNDRADGDSTVSYWLDM